MEQNKNVLTSKDATKSLIGNWLAWYVLFNIIYYMISNFLLSSIESSLVQVIIAIVLQALMVFCTWVMSTKFTFKDKFILSDDVRIVMKSLVIFTIVVCVADGIYQFVQAENTFNKVIDSSYELKIQEKRMEQIYSTEEMAEYNRQKNEIITDAKKQMYINIAIIEVVLVVIFLAMLPIEKKMISKHISESNNIVIPPVATTPPTSPASPSSPVPPASPSSPISPASPTPPSSSLSS